MRSFQDKVCDVFTFVCLLGVTAAGTVSLCIQANANASETATSIVEDAESVQTDTLKELPIVEDRPMVSEKPAETSSVDTTSAVALSTGDSTSHTYVNVRDEKEPDNCPVANENKEEDRKEDLQKVEEAPQDEYKSLID